MSLKKYNNFQDIPDITDNFLDISGFLSQIFRYSRFPANFPVFPANFLDFPDIPANFPDFPANFPNILDFTANFPDFPDIPDFPANFPDIPDLIGVDDHRCLNLLIWSHVLAIVITRFLSVLPVGLGL